MGLFGSKEVIGLDIGSSSIKMAHVKGVGVENRLRKFGVFPLPADSIVDGAIMDHAAVVEGIQTAMRELKVHEKEVAISFRGIRSSSRRCSSPPPRPRNSRNRSSGR
jgi:type IV pilus assembly protein PilM